MVFQRSTGLYPDGIASPKTIKAIQASKPGLPSPPAPPRQSMSAIGCQTAPNIGSDSVSLNQYVEAAISGSQLGSLRIDGRRDRDRMRS